MKLNTLHEARMMANTILKIQSGLMNIMENKDQ
jgi:hypothetical protein